jgi:hypothetical protein
MSDEESSSEEELSLPQLNSKPVLQPPDPKPAPHGVSVVHDAPGYQAAAGAGACNNRPRWISGSVLEALDCRGIWCIAKAIDERGRGLGHEVLIHYKGWNAKWDVRRRATILDHWSERLATPAVSC